MKDSKLIPLLPLEEYQRRRRRRESDISEVWDLLDAVKDPEIPVLSIWDLGVLQDIKKVGEELLVTITPTYSC
jgi:ring-1,2-phenylacetyl-CoA epoxidase subunit PaaD